MEAMGLHPRLVPGAQDFKVTYPDDFAWPARVLAQRRHGTTLGLFGGGRVAPTLDWLSTGLLHKPITERFLKQVASTWAEGEAMNFRIGGRMGRARTGARPPFGDWWRGDWAQHGASGSLRRRCTLQPSPMPCWAQPSLGDVGTHFPDTDPTFRGADSVPCWLKQPAGCDAAGCRLATSTAPWWPKRRVWQRTFTGMRACIAQALGVQPDQVNVKPRPEAPGPSGAGLAVEACCCADLPRLTVLFNGPCSPALAPVLQCAFAASFKPVYRAQLFEAQGSSPPRQRAQPASAAAGTTPRGSAGVSAELTSSWMSR